MSCHTGTLTQKRSPAHHWTFVGGSQCDGLCHSSQAQPAQPLTFIDRPWASPASSLFLLSTGLRPAWPQPLTSLSQTPHLNISQTPHFYYPDPSLLLANPPSLLVTRPLTSISHAGQTAPCRTGSDRAMPSKWASPSPPRCRWFFLQCGELAVKRGPLKK